MDLHRIRLDREWFSGFIEVSQQLRHAVAMVGFERIPKGFSIITQIEQSERLAPNLGARVETLLIPVEQGAVFGDPVHLLIISSRKADIGRRRLVAG